MNIIQIINNIENRTNAHWVVMKIASSYCKHCEKLSHLQNEHKFDNNIIFQVSKLLRYWIDFCHFYDIEKRAIDFIIWSNHIWKQRNCWLRCKMCNNYTNAKTLMIDLKEYEELSHSNVDLFQYFQLMKRISTISSLIKKLFDRSFAIKRIYWTFFYRKYTIAK